MTGALQVTEAAEGAWLICVAAPAALSSLGALEGAIGVPVPADAGGVGSAPGRTAYWLSPTSWLIELPPGEVDAALAAVAAAFPDRLIHAARYGDALRWFELTGDAAEALLKQGGFISLEPAGLAVGRVKRTQFAGIAAIVHRRGEADWRLGVERSRGAYLSAWIAAARTGVGPL